MNYGCGCLTLGNVRLTLTYTHTHPYTRLQTVAEMYSFNPMEFSVTRWPYYLCVYARSYTSTHTCQNGGYVSAAYTTPHSSDNDCMKCWIEAKISLGYASERTEESSVYACTCMCVCFHTYSWAEVRQKCSAEISGVWSVKEMKSFRCKLYICALLRMCVCLCMCICDFVRWSFCGYYGLCGCSSSIAVLFV